MKELLKRLAHVVLGEYAIYRILQRRTAAGPAPIPPQAAGFDIGPVQRAEIEACSDPLMREQAFYAGDGACAYACREGGRIVGLCFYWYGERYRPRGFWPLREGQAKLVQIITAPSMRGRKVAPALITVSAADLAEQGFECLFARVWHNNNPSLRAFAAAGWTRCALVVEVNPLRRARPWRLRFP
ncbi:GNAT family N-acetyltransferase [Pseudoduganella violaceinigra]|uniref:GNAT family N-acetyltransferase n=1 Tax=Pseudoduganella violaceinigra TaxID=246602 RepID=UPI000400D52A|nr:GNAT family N-acetyltransferase [Pseudoduganella violaceinigra]